MCHIIQLNQEGLPDYWGIETLPHQEGLPDYWGIETLLPTSELLCPNFNIRKATTGVLKFSNQEGLPDYWGIETFFLLHLSGRIPNKFGQNDQEGLPDYWGIETLTECVIIQLIRKDYPTTGVLKISNFLPNFG